jgi:dihydroneopterin aldolase
MTARAFIELRNLKLVAQIGTFVVTSDAPKEHRLDLTLGIDAGLVLIESDTMAHVFDYDPLVRDIDESSRDGYYETQERLITRIVQACAACSEIISVDINLRKGPVLNASGSLGKAGERVAVVTAIGCNKPA